MKLLIWTTGNPFTPSMLYKENYIIKAALEHGDEVMVYASKYCYAKGKEVSINNTETNLKYGLKRFEYKTLFNNFLTRKIRHAPGLIEETINYRPDLIFINCAQVYEIQFLDKVKRSLPNVRIVMDFSTKFINSAHGWLSLNILHKTIYKHWIHKALPYTDKVLYISAESKDFIMQVYDIPEEITEHNNLPGEKISKEEKQKNRKYVLQKHNLPADVIIIANSGKIGKLKRTDELIKAFSSVNDSRLRLFIIGRIEPEMESILNPLITNDKRIIHIEFLSGDELTRYLCATDMYMQPGTISQTSQTSICCGTPICFTDLPTHREIYNGNGFFIDTIDDMKKVLREIVRNPQLLQAMSEKSYQMADAELDYHVIYEKILRCCDLK